MFPRALCRSFAAAALVCLAAAAAAEEGAFAALVEQLAAKRFADRIAAVEALARSGGLAFIYTSQPIAAQAEMVQRVKKFKAGFVVSDTNLGPQATVRDLLELRHRTGHTTTAITDDGTPDGRLLGILTGRDYRVGHVDPNAPVTSLMTPFDDLVYGRDGITLSEANNLIWEHRLNCLPVIDEERRLRYLVFRKDYEAHKENPDELIDHEKRLLVGAGIYMLEFLNFSELAADGCHEGFFTASPLNVTGATGSPINPVFIG